jgi:hypothetical protein
MAAAGSVSREPGSAPYPTSPDPRSAADRNDRIDPAATPTLHTSTEREHDEQLAEGRVEPATTPRIGASHDRYLRSAIGATGLAVMNVASSVSRDAANSLPTIGYGAGETRMKTTQALNCNRRAQTT